MNIRIYRREIDYTATYKIDILDKLIIEDNRGYKLTQGKDIFGNEQFEEEFNGERTSVKRNILGGLEYQSGSEKALLRKDIVGQWAKLIQRFRSDEEVFLFLIEQFF